MAQIDNIVQVYISRQTAQIDIAAFDIPLLLVEMDDSDTGFTDRVRTYTTLEAVADDLGTSHVGYIMAQKLLGGEIRPATFKIGKVNSQTGSEETLVEALQAVIDLDDTWYAVMASSHDPVQVEELSDTIQAMRKIYFTSTQAVAAYDPASTTDIGVVLKNKGNFRTVVQYSPVADAQYPEAAWVGPQLVEVPGSNTWEYKTLTGVSVTPLSDTQITVLEDKGYNYYINVKGANITRRGKVAEGEWIDVIILVDWLHARMQEQIFYRLINTRKIPFTDAGAVIIENEIRSVLSQAEANGGVDGYTVSAPRVLDIPEMQRNARTMGDFTFEARLAGAVSVVIVRGVVHA